MQSIQNAARAITARAVVVVGMLKGGTAKTTSAWFIALYYAVVLGKRTLLIDADTISQSSWDWYKVAKAAAEAGGEPVPSNLVVVRHPFDDIAEYIREQRAAYYAIVVDAGGGNAKVFHEAVTEADRLIMPVSPTAIERRRYFATMEEAERAAERNTRQVTAHVVLVKVDGRTKIGRDAQADMRAPKDGTEPAPVTDAVIHAWVHYMEAFGTIPTELSEYGTLMKELDAA